MTTTPDPATVQAMMDFVPSHVPIGTLRSCAAVTDRLVAEARAEERAEAEAKFAPLMEALNRWTHGEGEPVGPYLPNEAGRTQDVKDAYLAALSPQEADRG